MKRKLLIGVLVLLGLAVILVNPLHSLIFAIGVWVYLVIKFRKQQAGISEKHLKWMKVSLAVTVCSFVVFVAAAIMHNVKYGLTKLEEPLYLFIALVASWVLALTSAGALAIFLKSQQKI